MRFWILVSAILAGSLAHGEESFNQVFTRLAKVDQFAIGGVGFAGVISQGEKDYRLLLSRPSALSDFERLLLEGNPQAKCYALFGIRTLSPGRFKDIVKSLRNVEDKVVIERGCIVSHETLGAVLKDIERDRYREVKASKFGS